MVLSENKNIWIDKHLKFIIASTLKKDAKCITKDFLSTLIELDLSDCMIQDLFGLEYAINLKHLNLSKNQITDANNLKYLKKLENLDLCHNHLDDISFLYKLTCLKSIDLSRNNIYHISDISNLKELIMLNISNNNIRDLSPITELEYKNLKVIATDQCILLNSVDINYGEDYIFSTPIKWNENTNVYLDNIQVSGKYHTIKSNKKPSFLYSISKVIVKKIFSNCLLKADFYHEVPFLKSGVLSGTIIQPILLKNTFIPSGLLNQNHTKQTANIYGEVKIDNYDITDEHIDKELKGKVITIITKDGDKIKCIINKNGKYKFKDLPSGRYTIIFPFLDKYKYLTPSLYICNLKEGENSEINLLLSKK